jgi:hypothetical protein
VKELAGKDSQDSPISHAKLAQLLHQMDLSPQGNTGFVNIATDSSGTADGKLMLACLQFRMLGVTEDLSSRLGHTPPPHRPFGRFGGIVAVDADRVVREFLNSQSLGKTSLESRLWRILAR